MALFNLCFRVAFLAALLPLSSGACVDIDLGMGKGTISNSNLSGSSVQSFNTPAENGRLNYSSGSSWCAGTSDTNPYLQIDLQTLHVICAVSTQGNSRADKWVKNYTLQFSTDGTNWFDYKEGGQVKFLIGNDDRNSEVKHVVYGVLTRYLRFLPNTHQGGVCMRTELFGVKQKPTCEIEAIGLAYGGKIPNSSFTASSHFSNEYKPSKGRLKGGPRGWGPVNRNKDGDYLQIDLLYEYIICAVATQGANGINEWTTQYKIHLSLSGTSFVTYQEDNVDRVFQGNSDQNGVVTNSLRKFSIARIIRFEPTAYKGYKVLRVEVYGVLLTKVPSQPPTAFKLTASSSSSITVSWQLPPVFARHGTITGFKLFYKKKGYGGSATILTISSGATLSRNVTGLDKYTEYEFQVLAFTSDGDGAKSPVEVERTKEDVPSKAPSSFTVIAVTSTIITASWQLPPPDSRNGIIQGFKFFLTINNGTGSSLYVTGLDKNTEYELQILAFTSVGDGPKSTAVTKKTQEAGKPIIKDLPKRTTTAIGELLVLTCEVTGVPEASVTWTKNGLTSIPRARLENNAKILIIKDVVPGDSGVYECKAVNMFGESRTATIVFVAVPPRIIEELSPSSVMCQKQTPCLLSCRATSYIPLNFSWTKDGQVPTGDNMKLLNNSIIVTPRDGRDYGDYVCHATNRLGSTTYKITLLVPNDNQVNDDKESVFFAIVIALSCIVVVLLIIICGLIWQWRRAVHYKRIPSKEKVNSYGVKSSPDQQSSDKQASDRSIYMELKPRPSTQESRVPSEYQSLQEKPENRGYYNRVLRKENSRKRNEEVYEEV